MKGNEGERKGKKSPRLFFLKTKEYFSLSEKKNSGDFWAKVGGTQSTRSAPRGPRFDSWQTQEIFIEFSWCCLRFIDGTAQVSRQRLENVNRTNLVLASGELVSRKSHLSPICGAHNFEDCLVYHSLSSTQSANQSDLRLSRDFKSLTCTTRSHFTKELWMSGSCSYGTSRDVCITKQTSFRIEPRLLCLIRSWSFLIR